MSVPPSLARRIDRLARRAHAFHRFAHHPLCGRYAGELIALRGRARICRGCTCTLLAAVVGSCCALVMVLPGVPLALVSLACFAVTLRSLARAPDPDRRRVNKLWTRGLPALVFSAALIALLRAPSALHVCLALALLLSCTWTLGRYRRRGPDRSACARCPEYASNAVCSGFREIVQAERAFSRRTQQLLAAADAAARGEVLSP
jgi:hypothetical protein